MNRYETPVALRRALEDRLMVLASQEDPAVDPVIQPACGHAIQMAAAWLDKGTAHAATMGKQPEESLWYTQQLLAAHTVAIRLVRGVAPSGEPIFAYVAVRMDCLVLWRLSK